VSLLTVYALSLGLLVASTESKSMYVEKFTGKRRAALAIVLASAVCSLPWLTRPFRADQLSLAADKSLYLEGDSERARSQMKEAVDLVPWNVQQKARFLKLLQETGDIGGYLDFGVDTTIQANCMPALAVGTANNLAVAGDFTRAIQIGKCAVEADPYAPNVRQDVASIFEAMAVASEQDGREDVAAAIRADLLSIIGDGTK
jgi:tetratricopeptide (TPR) repeat protein